MKFKRCIISLKALLTLTLLTISTCILAQEKFYLVTDDSQLRPGDKIIIGFLGKDIADYYDIYLLNTDKLTTKHVYSHSCLESPPTNTAVFELYSNENDWELKEINSNKYLQFDKSLNLSTASDIPISLDIKNGEAKIYSNSKSLSRENTNFTLGEYNVNNLICVFSNRPSYDTDKFANFDYLKATQNDFQELTCDNISCLLKKWNNEDVAPYFTAKFTTIYTNNLIEIKCNDPSQYVNSIEIYYYDTQDFSKRLSTINEDNEITYNYPVSSGYMYGLHGFWQAIDCKPSTVEIPITGSNIRITRIKVYYAPVNEQTVDPTLLPAPTVNYSFDDNNHIARLSATDENDQPIENAKIYYALIANGQAEPSNISDLTELYTSPIMLRYYPGEYKIWYAAIAPGHENSDILHTDDLYIGDDYGNFVNYSIIVDPNHIINNTPWYIITAKHEGSIYAVGPQNDNGEYAAIKLAKHADTIKAWADNFQELGIHEFKLVDGYLTDHRTSNKLAPATDYNISTLDATEPEQSTVFKIGDDLTHSLTVDGQSFGFDPDTNTFAFGHTSPISLYSNASGMNTAIMVTVPDPADIDPVYYNLQGIRVVRPTHGTFIKVTGDKATKIHIK